ncbi:MAG: hypothetical protein UV08_C0019G0003 [Parcubacteria group bacterium GW2011_GWA2_42_18]|nr:MAG: hypothetical protein UV08_C0019G0003 [Parcubacteria group bacterium GW2011_GWA2_42_18]
MDRRRRVLIWRLVITLVILGGLLGGLVVFLRLPVLAIKNIEVQGASALDKAELAAVAESVLQNNFTGLFPRKNFLIYPRRQIKEILSERFQRIEQMSLKVEEDNILVVEIKERQGEYLWCGLEPLEPDPSGECFFTDAQGYIFDQAPYFSGNVYFKIYGPPAQEWNLNIEWKLYVSRPCIFGLNRKGSAWRAVPRVLKYFSYVPEI